MITDKDSARRPRFIDRELCLGTECDDGIHALKALCESANVRCAQNLSVRGFGSAGARLVFHFVPGIHQCVIVKTQRREYARLGTMEC